MSYMYFRSPHFLFSIFSSRVFIRADLRQEITTTHSDSDANDAREFRDVTTFTTGGLLNLIYV